MEKEFYVFDDIVSKDYQDYIEYVIYQQDWFFKPTLSANTEVNESENFTDVPGFVNVFYNNNGVNNQWLYDTCLPLAHICCNKVNVKFNQIYFGRTFLQQPVTTHSGISNPHVDMQNFDHMVCLYYVKDSDGSTVFFDKKSTSEKRPSFSDYKIVEEVEPKKGRVVIFDGRIYHANYRPQKNLRSVINMNLGVSQ